MDCPHGKFSVACLLLVLINLLLAHFLFPAELILLPCLANRFSSKGRDVTGVILLLRNKSPICCYA